jgi:TrpR family trp operon transcriptional repressor
MPRPRADSGVRELAGLLAGARDAALVEDFLISLLTPRELRQVSRRWALVKLLDQGVSQRTISRRLGMSLCKITRGSKELKKRNSAFKRMMSTRRNPNEH